MMRIGFGYDIHRLKKKKRLFLGGVEIPFSRGLEGHSDGDCLIHAVIDALLGAIGDKDIGTLFPPDAQRFKNIRSTLLLKEVAAKLKRKRTKIINIDSVIVAEQPKMAPHIPAMKQTLCPILNLRPGDFGIKAKTNEGLGLIGEGSAMACWAVVLVDKTN